MKTLPSLFTTFCFVLLASCNVRSASGHLEVAENFHLPNQDTKLNLRSGRWKVSLFRWVGGDPRITFEGPEGKLSFTLPKSAIKSEYEIQSAAAENQLGYDIHAYRKTETLRSHLEEGSHSCSYYGYCFGLGTNGKMSYGYHFNCSGSQRALFEITDYKSYYLIDFSENGDAAAKFHSDDEFSSNQRLVQTLSPCG